MAQKKVFALLVSDKDDSFFEELKVLLKRQSMEVWNAESCDETARLLEQTHPELIFTAKMLPDGTWVNVISLAEKAPVPTNVIVVGRNQDTRLYLDTMDHGAFDFILPPFTTDPIAHVVRVAAENVRRRRDEQAIKAVA